MGRPRVPAAPITADDAARAVRSHRRWPSLDGFRGSPRAEVSTVEDLVVSVARLALEVPAISELDLNPVLVAPLGCTVVDVTLRLSSTTPSLPPEAQGLRAVS